MKYVSTSDDSVDAMTPKRRNDRPPPNLARYRQAGELRRALQDFTRETERVARQHGLTTERYQLLLFVKLAVRDGGGATVGELAEDLHLANSTVTQLVRRAENLGLIRRELSERDARIRYLRLTEEGERRLAATVSELGQDRARLSALLARQAEGRTSRTKRGAEPQG
jgi:DNA-binding MarR family transcriptional regulator